MFKVLGLIAQRLFFYLGMYGPGIQDQGTDEETQARVQ